MEINKLSQIFTVKKLSEENLCEMLALCKKNTLFFKHCPPFPTKESLCEDLYALPTKKTIMDKFFVGFYDNNSLVAICDIIKGYPQEQTVYVGLLMVDKALQGHGIGSKIVQQMFDYFKQEGFEKVELSYVKGNPQSKAFWLKNGFRETGREVEAEEYTKVCMEKYL